jgi:endonuclease/exonuclease/phosphatase family metal-dependent hydrolase
MEGGKGLAQEPAAGKPAFGGGAEGVDRDAAPAGSLALGDERRFAGKTTMPHLRLLTFNIAHGRGLNPFQGLTSQRKLRLNLRRIATLLGRIAPDVVALQEIDERSRWAGNFDHLDYLRVHTRFPHSVFGINNRRAGLLNLSYGNALLSRHPFRAAETVVFGQRRVGEKGFLYVELEVGGRCLPLVNLHLHFGSRAQRLRQLERLLTWLREKHRLHRKAWALPPIICGDFNNPGSRDDATASLLSHLSDYCDYSLHPVTAKTFPSPLPRRALDFVFLPAGCRHVRCEVVRSLLSDHLPVVVEFDF